MQALEKRIAALEQVSYSNTDEVMFIHFLGMGEADKEIQRIKNGGQEWERQPDESEQALKDRAQRETKPNPQGTPMFLCFRQAAKSLCVPDDAEVT